MCTDIHGQTQVDPTTVASDSFMLNMQSVLLRFAEPFMDANFTKASAVVGLWWWNVLLKFSRWSALILCTTVHSSRIDLNDETRIKATSEEAQQWKDEHALHQEVCVWPLILEITS